jgi:hypothetical protein
MCAALSLLTPGDGVCIAAGCQIFGANCGGGLTCAPFGRNGATGWLTYCRVVGQITEGNPCGADVDCADGTACITSVCMKLCDGSHGCGANQMCTPLQGLPNGAGACTAMKGG